MECWEWSYEICVLPGRMRQNGPLPFMFACFHRLLSSHPGFLCASTAGFSLIVLSSWTLSFTSSSCPKTNLMQRNFNSSHYWPFPIYHQAELPPCFPTAFVLKHDSENIPVLLICFQDFGQWQRPGQYTHSQLNVERKDMIVLINFLQLSPRFLGWDYYFYVPLIPHLWN